MKIKWKVVSPYNGIEEDAPVNWAGGGNVHGIGVGPHGEPGIDPKKKKKRQTLIDRDGKIDGRSKAYREHRRKLEAVRQKRLERKNSSGSKFIENIKNKTIEMAYGHGFDIVKPMADMSNRNLQASKKKKKK
jgi:hypothetical protein